MQWEVFSLWPIDHFDKMKLKMKTLLNVFISIVMSCVIISCDQNMMEHHVPSEHSTSASFSGDKDESSCYYDCDSDANISNLLNPYDEVGVTHNDILCEFYGTYGSFSNGANLGQLDNLLHEQFPNNTSFSSEAFSQDILRVLEKGNIEAYLNEVSDETNKPLLRELIAIMAHYNGSNLCGIISNIKELENNALSRNDAQKIQQFLMASSVARYSFSFWDPYLQDSDLSADKLFKKFWRKLFVAAADVFGAISGGSAGSVVGPAGTVAGAITGASAASVGADELWDLWD